jgi:anti-sigma B factor antagonist
MNPIVLDASFDEGTVRVRFEGELDLSTVPDAEEFVSNIEREHTPEMLVLDLRELRFLDSSGLRFILAVDSRARREGRRLQIVPGPEAVNRVFRIALLDKRLEFVEETEAGGA